MNRRCVAGLCLALLASLSGCGGVGGQSLEATAVLKEAAGLYVGNDVGVLGVPVGKVTKVEPKGSLVHVTFEVTDPDVRVPADAAAVVVSRSVATDRYIELTPIYKGGATLPEGAVIPLSRTRTPVDFDQVLNSLADLAGELTASPKATRGIREVVQTIAAAFAGNSDEVNAAVHGLADLVGTVHGQRTNLFATMDSLDRFSRGLVDHEELIRTFVADLGDALDLLSSEREDIERALKAVSKTVDRVAEFSQDNRVAVRTSVDKLVILMNTFLESRADLGTAVEVLPLATENIAKSADGQGNIWVRIKPAELLGLGPVFEQLCAALGPVCNLATFPDLPDLLGGLTP